jgi:hypothetical protein
MIVILRRERSEPRRMSGPSPFEGRAISAFTRGFDALWHGHLRVTDRNA